MFRYLAWPKFFHATALRVKTPPEHLCTGRWLDAFPWPRLSAGLNRIDWRPNPDLAAQQIEQYDDTFLVIEAVK